MKYSEKWGDSIDAAVEFALQDLKLTKDQVKVTVLEEPSKGFLGIGSKLAKVRVEEIVPEKPKKEAPKAEVKTVSTEVKKEEKKEHPQKQKKKEKQEKVKKTRDIEDIDIELVSARPADLTEVQEHIAKDFLTKVAKDMGIEIEIKVFVNKDSVYVDIEGKDTGTVIGKRGATLDSVQYLTSLVVNKETENYVRVIVDAEGYRAKREATLEKLALRLADKAIKTGRSVRLEPMNPYERKVIHSTLQSVPTVTTKSEGAEPYRKVVIVPARK